MLYLYILPCTYLFALFLWRCLIKKYSLPEFRARSKASPVKSCCCRSPFHVSDRDRTVTGGKIGLARGRNGSTWPLCIHNSTAFSRLPMVGDSTFESIPRRHPVPGSLFPFCSELQRAERTTQNLELHKRREPTIVSGFELTPFWVPPCP